jgi:hypothetical protein
MKKIAPSTNVLQICGLVQIQAIAYLNKNCATENPIVPEERTKKLAVCFLDCLPKFTAHFQLTICVQVLVVKPDVVHRQAAVLAHVLKAIN